MGKEQGFSVDIRKRRTGKLLKAIAAIAALGAAAGLAGCGNTEQTPQTPTPGVTDRVTPPVSIHPTTEATPTPLLTPEFTPAPAFESLPAVPDEFKTSWQAILDYWRTLQYARGSLRLVENERVRIEVARTGTGDVPLSNGLIVIIENPGSAEVARQIKGEITKEICEIAIPIIPEGINWKVAVVNAGLNPYAELGFIEQEAQDFRTVTNCEVPAQ